jgi:hypothetical protein
MEYKRFGMNDLPIVTGKREMVKNLFKGIFDKVMQRTKITQINNLYTYVKFAKNMWFVIVVLAGVFLVIKIIRQYRIKKLRGIVEKQLEERKRAFQAEEDLKNSMLMDLLLAQIFESKEQNVKNDNEGSFKIHKGKLLFPLDEDNTTNHCSCSYENEECAAWDNGNISEISYWDDVISNCPELIHQHKIKEYLNLVMHNPGSWSQYAKTIDDMNLRKKLMKFNQAYNNNKNVVMSQSLRGRC